MSIKEPTVRRKRILVVDDEPENCDLLYVALTSRDFEVDVAGSALEALELFAEKTYDLVTLDFQMPGMDGLELQRRIVRLSGLRQRVSPWLPQRLPPALVITAHATEDLARALMGTAQVVEVMQKPVNMERLVKAVHELIERGELHHKRRTRALACLGYRVCSSAASCEPVKTDASAAQAPKGPKGDLVNFLKT
jgi:CheY-like chemotaxis protein